MWFPCQNFSGGCGQKLNILMRFQSKNAVFKISPAWCGGDLSDQLLEGHFE